LTCSLYARQQDSWHLHGYYEVMMPYKFQRPNKQVSPAIVWVQVIPAGSTAKFPVVFSDSRVQHFQQTVEYVVNGCHIFTFQVLHSPSRSALPCLALLRLLSIALSILKCCTFYIQLHIGLLHCFATCMFFVLGTLNADQFHGPTTPSRLK